MFEAAFNNIDRALRREEGFASELDYAKLTTSGAGEYQVSGSKTVGALTIGGSGTTNYAFVVGR